MPVLKATPEVVEMIRQGIANHESRRAMAERIGLSSSAISRAIKRHGIETWDPQEIHARQAKKLERGIPDGFAEIAPTLTMGENRKRWKAGRCTIRRWLREAGIDYRRAPVKASEPVTTIKPSTRRGPMAAPIVYRRDDSEAGEAARYLQPDHIPVYRCKPNGKQDFAGSHWRCGRLVLTDDEIIARAAAFKERRMALRSQLRASLA